MKNSPQYVRYAQTGVYLREGYRGIEYSDGVEIEERLLREMLSCQDVSDASEQLRGRISDWPSEYHFSPLRANLLRPFDFKGMQVLELGCGCGAITRFLGEAGAQVIAVEGSPRRAAIAAARCRDLPNVQVYCDNLAEFSAPFRFDAVTLIGVLEYARLFIPGDDPVRNCLRIARDHLKESGVLYVAIENQLGLKYFNGCSEDHAGIPYFGIDDRYRANTAVTFGKKELTQRVRDAGFEDTEFFFPYPDYKLPEAVLSEAAFDSGALRAGDLLYRIRSRDNGLQFTPSFNENLAWQVLARNGVAGQLSNSFLVRAHRTAPARKAAWLAHSYSTGRRRAFAAQNVILARHDGLKVVKQPVFSPGAEASAEAQLFEHVTGEQDYIAGSIYLGGLQRIFSDGGAVPELAAWAAPWLAFLRAHADAAGNLPAEYADCIPANLIRDERGQLHYIDAEWRAGRPVPLMWVAIRGVVLSLSACPPARPLGADPCRQIVAQVLEHAGLHPAEQDWAIAAQWEDDLRRQCYGEFGDPVPLAERLARPWTSCLYTRTDLERDNRNELADARRELDLYRREVERIKASVSWRLTKPVRLLQNLWRRLVN